MKLVILESPYAAHDPAVLQKNVDYARKCVRHSLGLGEAPLASHLLYTQPGILNDEIPSERDWGIHAGLAWRSVEDVVTVAYIDRGISKGMQYSIDLAHRNGNEVIYREIGQ